MILFLGITAAVLTTMSFLPQVIKAYRTKETKDISLGMYVMFSLGLMIWTVYGLLLHQVPIIAANGVTLILSFCIIYLKVKHG